VYATSALKALRSTGELLRHIGAHSLVAVLPQPVQEGRQYLGKLGLEVGEVVQAPLNSINVWGAPVMEEALNAPHAKVKDTHDAQLERWAWDVILNFAH